MSRRIETGLSSRLNPFGPDWSGVKSAQNSQSIGDQVQDSLFGKPKPPLVNPEDYTDLDELMAKLNSYRRKFSIMSGESENEYKFLLADSTIAMIDAHGNIYLGVNFLRTFKKKIEVIVGAVAHEIGHRPKRWKKYKTRINLTPKELDRLCRAEETFADFFAGRALAEVNLSPQPLIDFLLKNDTGPHREYFPAKMRADVIMRGFNEQNFRIKARKRLFPQQNRMTSIKGHIGNY